MPHSYEYPRPALTVDCVVFGFDDGALKILLIRRGLEPFKGRWALPGGFVRVEEEIDAAARRELAEEAGVSGVYLEQLYTFGGLHRDPRERVVSVAYYALVRQEDMSPAAATDADEAKWFELAKVPSLAFDHAQILETALKRLRSKLRYEPVGFELLPAKFTLSQLQHLYEAVLGVELDKRNFRKKFLSFKLLTPLNETFSAGRQRPAQLFRFDATRYERLKKRGFLFEV
jgi:8-oxo-dGTP diphosphatase